MVVDMETISCDSSGACSVKADLCESIVVGYQIERRKVSSSDVCVQHLSLVEDGLMVVVVGVMLLWWCYLYCFFFIYNKGNVILIMFL